MFAERTLGDAGRWTELWDLNQHRVVGEQGERWVAPWKVSAGWDLRLPERAAPAVARRSSSAVVGVHDVVAGDSYWAIAESLLPPDAAPGAVLDYTNALIEANASRLGYDDPHLLRPGDVLDVVAPPSGDAVPPTPVTSHRVVAGDSYWAIAEETLGDAAPAAEVAARTHELIDLNAPRLGYDDVRMIHPGDEVVLAVAAPAPPPAAEVFDDLWNAPAPATPAPPPETVPPTTTTLPPPTTTTPTSTTTTTTTHDAAAADRTGCRDARRTGDHPSPSPSPIGLGEAGLLAAGILALLGARRRARLRAGRGASAAAAAAAAVGGARAAAPGDREQRAAVARRRGVARRRAGGGRARSTGAPRARRRRRHDRAGPVRSRRTAGAMGARRHVVVASTTRRGRRAGRRRPDRRRTVRRRHDARHRRRRVRGAGRRRGARRAVDRRRRPRRRRRPGDRRWAGVVGAGRGRPPRRCRTRRRRRFRRACSGTATPRSSTRSTRRSSWGPS